MALINLLALLLFVTCMVTVFYSLFFSIAGHFYRIKKYDNKDQFKKIAVFMPAYKEDEVILNTAKHALLQNYPSHCYDVYVIADSLKEETLLELKRLPIQLISVSFEKSTKSKAINSAFNQIKAHYDLAVILDADNIMHIDFLDKVNAAAVSGCYAIQGHRMAKNKNTRYAILDAISEEVNNHIMRKGQIAVGLSSSVIGSGMAFSYIYLRQVMSEIDAVGGFDKELEMTLIDDNHQIVYLEDAIVLDEKVQKSEVFVNQRTRWVAAQMVYLKKYWMRGIYNLLRGRIDYANKVMHYALVPKVILLGVLLFMLILNLVFPSIQPGPYLWVGLAVTYFLAYAIAIPKTYWNKDMLQAIASLPKTIWVMCKAMLNIKGANKQFIHTPHTAHFEKTTI
jgi:cellulose synthase/poly-beta-1,6-N-acetylglucosamine synthase-like glycosyltransferase